MNDRIDLSTTFAAFQDGPRAMQGKRYWRSLEELADSEAFRQLMLREFPAQASEWPDRLSRRNFLTLMGASLALGGLSGCSVRPAPSKDIVPYVRAPEELVPGKPLFYATTMSLGGAGVGLLAESHLGRPTKIEGNPDHPASLGATSAFHQAAVLSLYDPDRSKTVLHLGQTTTWEAAARALRGAMRSQRERRGAGLRLLTETVVSPTLGDQIRSLLKDLPEAKWHQYEPLHRDTVYRANQWAFGRAAATRYDFTKADVVLSLDADFLTAGPGSLRYTADFMAGRRVRTSERDAAGAQMNRLYVAEPAVSCTGAKADHRLAIAGREIEQLARAVTAALGIDGAANSASPHERWAAAVAKDLTARRGRSLVLAGDRQPAVVHLLAHAMNDHLNNAGQTVIYTDPVEIEAVDQTRSLEQLVDDIERGQVELLLILGGNPVYTAPADLEFASRLDRVPLRAHLSLFNDETSRRCHWHLPEAHFLEAWGDAVAYDGTASLVQPLIEPLYQGRSVHEVLELLASGRAVPGLEIVRRYWRGHLEQQVSARPDRPETAFDDLWQQSLHDGRIAGTAREAGKFELQEGWQQHLQAAAPDGRQSAAGASTGDLEIVFEPDPTLYDGRFANNGWLQELPKSMTKLTWGNAAIMSPQTARELGLPAGSYAHGGEHGGYHMPVLELEVGNRRVRAPLWLMPGHAERAVTVYLGHGRVAAGAVGGTSDETVGFDAYRLRTTSHPWFARGLRVVPTGDRELVACTQQHHQMENREVIRAATLEQYRSQPSFAAEKDSAGDRPGPRPTDNLLTFYEPYDYAPPKHKWGMVIDLTTCTGCNACVVACQAENNIPVVGKEQVAAGREMHWLRIDRYTHGAADAPEEFYFQPLPCMHCENAPCEYVCPVEATVHSAEGLNDMVYNRCVGTRFCSNNCPYKVRRFNFLAYADFETQTRRMQYNPDVTVRSRGVMEKCTYCIQRLRQADIAAQVEDRPLVDGEVLTACQAVCPAQAIVFGDLNDPQSKVRAARDLPLEYGLLADQNTRPRTTYLAAVRNPNPELEAE
jgi:MoCo/4Fe-4S cofactor protein with predicted Tat translocation signal